MQNFKKNIRKKYQLKRNALSSNNIKELSLQIANKCLEIPIWKKNFYHIFLSIKQKNEVDTEPLLSLLMGKNKKIIIPKINKKNTLDNILLDENTIIKTNDFGIPEPQNGVLLINRKIEVVFVPLYAFDLKGHRVGYGKGFYDKLLANCRPETIKVGVSFFNAVNKISDISKHDISLNYVVTPNATFDF